MPGTYNIQVQTVYSAEGTKSAAGLRLRLLGVVTFAVALAWLYVTWQPMFQWVQKTLAFGEINVDMGSTGRGARGDDLDAFARIVDPGKPRGTSSKRAAGKKRPARPKPASASPAAKAEAQRAKNVLRAAAGGWLATATFVGLWLAMSGIAGISSRRASRRAGLLLLPLGVVAAGALAWYVWSEYEWYFSILPSWVMPTMLALCVLFAASLGATVNRRAVRLLRAGGGLVIFSAVVSVAAIWAAVHWGRMPPQQVNAALYAKVFVVQSAYGWLVLLGTVGLR